MATTDAKAGFRLPWSSDRQATDPADESVTAEVDAPTDGAPDPHWPGTDDVSAATAEPGDPGPLGAGPSPASAPASAPASPAAPAPAASRKPSRFLADMTKAMQAAAEDARTRSLTQLQADAKAHIESIHGRSSSEAANLRKAADDDVAAVREWSKAEIARIREETEARIADRKTRLEREIEGHAAVIEREIEAVQATVASFEAEMAAFFERLLAEEDPTHFATLFENLPEPPALENIVVADPTPAPADEPVAAVEPSVAVVEPSIAAPDRAPEAVAVDAVEVPALEATPDAEPAMVEAETSVAPALETAEADLDTPDTAQALSDDPRFAALGLSPDFDAAEAEAFADAGPTDDEEIEIPIIGDDALAARLAGLVPNEDGAGDTVTTRVVVVGLVSVASIASFKRHLGRLPGVSSVGVSSGPEGEFVFAVGHVPDLALRDVIPGLPTFQARVTASSDDAVHVTAHDPESDA